MALNKSTSDGIRPFEIAATDTAVDDDVANGDDVDEEEEVDDEDSILNGSHKLVACL